MMQWLTYRAKAHAVLEKSETNLLSCRVCPSLLLQNGACFPSDVRRINNSTIVSFSTIPTAEVIVADKNICFYNCCC